MKVVIHANQIEWQQRYAKLVIAGLKKHNITDVNVTRSPKRQPCDVAVLMGPNSWIKAETPNQPYIMLNRKLVGNRPEIVHENCSISWGGFNGNGTFCVDEVDPNRLLKYISLEEISPWVKGDDLIFMCEQSNVGRSTTFKTLQQFYHHVKTTSQSPVHFRRKPIGEESISYRKFKREVSVAKALVSLNSTVSIDALMAGVPTITLDQGDPAWAITSHNVNQITYPDRLPFFQYLAHCQWHQNEIESGEFWEHIYPMRGPKLHEWDGNNGSTR